MYTSITMLRNKYESKVGGYVYLDLILHARLQLGSPMGELRPG